jgi:hypothetical protein
MSKMAHTQEQARALSPLAFRRGRVKTGAQDQSEVIMSVHTPFLLASLLLATPAVAQSPMGEAPACPAPVAPTGLLAPWNAPVPVKAGADGAHAALLTGGQAAQVDLLPTPSVSYPLQPEKPGGSVSHGGVLALDVKQAGTWRIALGSGRGWMWWAMMARNDPPRMAMDQSAAVSARWSISR